MNHLNNVLLEGISTQPAIKAVARDGESWGKLVTFSIANHRYHKGKSGQTEEETLWMNVKCWGELADNCLRFIEKGMTVRVVGRLADYSYRAKDGTEKKGVNIIAQHFEFRFKRKDDKGKGEVMILDENEDEAEKAGEPEFVYDYE